MFELQTKPNYRRILILKKEILEKYSAVRKTFLRCRSSNYISSTNFRKFIVPLKIKTY